VRDGKGDGLARLLTRRAFLGGAAALGASMLAACVTGPTLGPATPTTSASPPPSPSPGATITPLPSPSPTPALTLRQVIAGLIVVGFRGLTVETAGPVVESIAKDHLAGVILFNRDQATGGLRNITSPTQLDALTAGLQKLAAPRRLLISIDQEGGEVVRLNPANGYPTMASEASIGRTNDDATTLKWGRLIGRTLHGAGINLNFAPVVDLNVNPTNPAIGALDRSFSASAATVSRLAGIEIGAHHEFAVQTTLKHFPGLGSATVNTDYGVADVTKTWTSKELDPYRTLITAGQVDLIMAGHLVNRNLDPTYPASLSKSIVTDLLRGQLGWDGVVVTDSLGAVAITSQFGASEAIALAIEAGNDLLLFANQGKYDGNLASHVIDIVAGHVASGRITRERLEQSLARVQRLYAD
jgi:beta-N-acetylhexosaminidase